MLSIHRFLDTITPAVLLELPGTDTPYVVLKTRLKFRIFPFTRTLQSPNGFYHFVSSFSPIPMFVTVWVFCLVCQPLRQRERVEMEFFNTMLNVGVGGDDKKIKGLDVSFLLR